MAESINCERHGESQPAFVCCHLVRDSFGLGFNRNPPIDEDPFPDAWCDKCEAVFQQHGGEWTAEGMKLADIKYICSNCYEQIRVRNAVADTA